MVGDSNGLKDLEARISMTASSQQHSRMRPLRLLAPAA
jgi:hypothetical protein